MKLILPSVPDEPGIYFVQVIPITKFLVGYSYDLRKTFEDLDKELSEGVFWNRTIQEYNDFDGSCVLFDYERLEPGKDLMHRHWMSVITTPRLSTKILNTKKEVKAVSDYLKRLHSVLKDPLF